MLNRILILFITLFFIPTALLSQDTTELFRISPKHLDAISRKFAFLEQKLSRHSAKALHQLQRQENKIKGKLEKIDSIAAKNIFSGAESKYSLLEQKTYEKELKKYIPQMDSLSTSLKFLQTNPQFISQVKNAQVKLKEAIGKMDALRGQLQKAEDVKQFLKERKQYLKEQLSKFDLGKSLKKITKQSYYYAQQVNAYKEILRNPKRVGKKVLELLSKNGQFRDFMRKNSILSTLFRIPGGETDPGYAASLSGLQTRAQVSNILQLRISAAGPNALQQAQQNMQSAQSQLNELRNKISKIGGSSNETEMPEGFRPNNQKTKSFLKRLEIGANIQAQKGGTFFPNIGDVGISIGYKLNQKSLIGIGGSYKVGFGRGWDAIRITSEGMGIRSFMDYRLKNSLWISGGYELNYKANINSISQLQAVHAWQQSGLVGFSQKIPIKTKIFKGTKLLLLWDFLSSQQRPKTPAFLFRVGYNF